MKVCIKDLLNISGERKIDVDIKEIIIDNNPFIKRIVNTKGDFTFYYDYEDKLCLNYFLEGEMVCPDAYTLEDVYVPFSLNEDEEVATDLNYEGFYIKEVNELEDLIKEIVMPEAPIMVKKDN